jgi:lipid-A-disaccharide synthase
MTSALLLTNGPGELWGWVRPLAAELASRKWEVAVAILPCPFSTGMERPVAERMGPFKVLGPQGPLKTAVSMVRSPLNPDVVVQLGGDLLWGRLAAWRAKCPLLCYSYGKKNGLHRCAGVFTAYPSMAEAIGGASVVGDLVQDAMELSGGPRISPDEGQGNTVAFFPGSRRSYRPFAVRFFQEVLRELRGEFPDLAARIVLSPFAPEGEEYDWRAMGLQPVRGGGREALRGVDLAITQPGTNTLELMYCAVPFLVMVPFDVLRDIPVSGLAGMVASIPWLGPKLKEKELRRRSRRITFLAWPNRIAKEGVVDEFFGDFTSGEAAERIASRLRDREWLVRTKEKLLATAEAAPKGAARRVADEMEKVVGGP